jgi:hypothetical protein
MISEFNTDVRSRTNPVEVLSALRRQIELLPLDSTDAILLAQIFLWLKRLVAAGKWEHEV